ncbi:hypothetical protein GCM10018965_098300 [Nonomuraea roseola]
MDAPKIVILAPSSGCDIDSGESPAVKEAPPRVRQIVSVSFRTVGPLSTADRNPCAKTTMTPYRIHLDIPQSCPVE